MTKIKTKRIDFETPTTNRSIKLKKKIKSKEWKPNIVNKEIKGGCNWKAKLRNELKQNK